MCAGMINGAKRNIPIKSQCWGSLGASAYPNHYRCTVEPPLALRTPCRPASQLPPYEEVPMAAGAPVRHQHDAARPQRGLHPPGGAGGEGRHHGAGHLAGVHRGGEGGQFAQKARVQAHLAGGAHASTRAKDSHTRPRAHPCIVCCNPRDASCIAFSAAGLHRRTCTAALPGTAGVVLHTEGVQAVAGAQQVQHPHQRAGGTYRLVQRTRSPAGERPPRCGYTSFFLFVLFPRCFLLKTTPCCTPALSGGRFHGSSPVAGVHHGSVPPQAELLETCSVSGRDCALNVLKPVMYTTANKSVREPAGASHFPLPEFLHLHSRHIPKGIPTTDTLHGHLGILVLVLESVLALKPHNKA